MLYGRCGTRAVDSEEEAIVYALNTGEPKIVHFKVDVPIDEPERLIHTFAGLLALDGAWRLIRTTCLETDEDDVLDDEESPDCWRGFFIREDSDGVTLEELPTLNAAVEKAVRG